mmetsp:Transcript_44412/g.128523  ORF Transcript_44412/g.128523 Transcript_44412/m.128523 type:complete len:297 (+) Transcript_44412:583-1473(+)
MPVLHTRELSCVVPVRFEAVEDGLRGEDGVGLARDLAGAEGVQGGGPVRGPRQPRSHDGDPQALQLFRRRQRRHRAGRQVASGDLRRVPGGVEAVWSLRDAHAQRTRHRGRGLWQYPQTLNGDGDRQGARGPAPRQRDLALEAVREEVPAGEHGPAGDLLRPLPASPLGLAVLQHREVQRVARGDARDLRGVVPNRVQAAGRDRREPRPRLARDLAAAVEPRVLGLAGRPPVLLSPAPRARDGDRQLRNLPAAAGSLHRGPGPASTGPGPGCQRAFTRAAAPLASVGSGRTGSRGD